MLTLDELIERIGDRLDPDELVERLGLSTEQILDRFADELEARFDELNEEFEDEQS